MATLPNRNVVVAIFDDVGKDKLACYGAQPFQPPTPEITARAAAGVRFTNCYVNPACSHTRALAGTGRYGFRTGIGGLVDTDLEAPLPAREIFLPRLLQLAGPGQVDTALIGKWHLSNAQNGSWLAPNRFGFNYFAGLKGNIRSDGGPGYFAWNRGVNGRVAMETTYNTTKLVDDAIAWVNSHSSTQPFFLWLAFTAPHTPFDRPPASLYDASAYTGLGEPYPLPAATAPQGHEPAYFNAMMQALSKEYGRFWSSITPALAANTTEFAFGDNGTTSAAITAPFDPTHGKASGYELGVNCPFYVTGNGVASPGRVNSGLVSIGDMFTTIAQLYGIDPVTILPKGRTLDGVSFKQILDSFGGVSTRTRLFAEQFATNGPYPTSKEQLKNSIRAIRDATYKLLVQRDANADPRPDELYNLSLDPNETVNLATGTIGGADLTAYNTLTSDLAALLATV